MIFSLAFSTLAGFIRDLLAISRPLYRYSYRCGVEEGRLDVWQLLGRWVWDEWDDLSVRSNLSRTTLRRPQCDYWEDQSCFEAPVVDSPSTSAGQKPTASWSLKGGHSDLFHCILHAC